MKRFERFEKLNEHFINIFLPNDKFDEYWNDIDNLNVKYKYLQIEYSIFHNQIIEDDYSYEVI